MSTRPDVWLRGPINAIAPSLQPIAHALLQTAEDSERAARGLSQKQLWLTPSGAASIGFHLRHIAGSTDRLLTYSRSAPLDDRQRAYLAVESSVDPYEKAETAETLLVAVQEVVESVLSELRRIDLDSLDAPITIGAARLPSTVRGALTHAAEHAYRHAGQALTTAIIVRR